MEKNKLSSFLGDAFVNAFYLMGVILFCMLIYTIIVLDFSGIYASIFFLLFYTLVFGRKIVKFKKVYFDKNYVYVNKFEKISLQEIKKFGDNKIEFFHNGKNQIIHFNHYFPSKNYSILRKYIEEATQV